MANDNEFIAPLVSIYGVADNPIQVSCSFAVGTPTIDGTGVNPYAIYGSIATRAEIHSTVMNGIVISGNFASPLVSISIGMSPDISINAPCPSINSVVDNPIWVNSTLHSPMAAMSSSGYAQEVGSGDFRVSAPIISSNVSNYGLNVGTFVAPVCAMSSVVVVDISVTSSFIAKVPQIRSSMLVPLHYEIIKNHREGVCSSPIWLN